MTFSRRIAEGLEAAGVWLAFACFKLLPLEAASRLGGALARLVGPLLPQNRYARGNLARAFPEKSVAEIARILPAMWEQVGRVLAEYPHLGEFRPYEPGGHVEVAGAEILDRLREAGGAAIFFSAHLGNWEIASIGVRQRGIPITLFYRAPNNPLVDRLIRHARGPTADGLLQKGAEGGRGAIKALREGRRLGMLVDQKMNDGIAVPFFGRPAMTAPALARFAYRYGCPIVPVRVERLTGARFRLTFHEPLALDGTGDLHGDMVALMTRVNALIESWIRARPEQWLWIHRRWPD
jgi:Kdo2-lipid IVA lauroyltransferase/acyltransferase